MLVVAHSPMLTNLLILTAFITKPLFIDFGATKTNNWFALNDPVMGGRSEGFVGYDENALLFEGCISFENNGGFASVRSDYESLDLSAYETVEIRYRSEKQSISLNLNCHREWYLPKYKKLLPPTAMEWKTVVLDLNSFDEYRAGKATGNRVSKEKLRKIIRLVFMTNDKKEGPFKAAFDYIRFD
jgi:hypothetical protein